MALDRNKVIRIVLEGKDNLSKVVKKAVTDVDKDLDKLGDSLDKTGDDFDRLNKDIDKALSSIEKRTKTFSDRLRTALGKNKKVIDDQIAARAAQARKEIDAIKKVRDEQIAALKDQEIAIQDRLQKENKLRREAARRISLVGDRRDTDISNLRDQRIQQVLGKSPDFRERGGAVGGLFAGFQEGRRLAAETERIINEQIATTEEELKKRRKELAEETAIKRADLRKTHFDERQAQTEINRLRKEQLQKDNDELIKKASEEQEKADKERQDKINKAQLEFDRVRAEAQDRINKQRDENVLRKQESFDKKRRAAEEKLADDIFQRQEDFEDAKLKRQLELDEQIAKIRERGLAKAAREAEIRQAKADAKTDIRALAKERKLDIRDLEKADDRVKRGEAKDRDQALAQIRNAAREQDDRNKQSARKKLEAELAVINELSDTEKKRNLEILNEKIKANKKLAADAQRESDFKLSDRLRKEVADFEAEAKRLKAALSGEGATSIIEKALAKREELLHASNDADTLREKLEKTGRRAGVAFGDFFRGIRRGRGDLRELDNVAKGTETTFARFGKSIGRFTKNLGTMINLRWFFLISIIQLLGHAIVVLGSSLVALASSAIEAGAALGVAFVAGISQALPVVALFAAVMQRLSAVMEAVKLAQSNQLKDASADKAQKKAQREATEALADAHWSLKKAKEAVADSEIELKDAHDAVTRAQREQKDAVTALAKARRDAARDIVDANNDEKDAELGLQEAVLNVAQAEQKLIDVRKKADQQQQDINEAKAAVREAQERLKLAQAEGDQAEIEKAQQQLALAKQNLSDIKDQESGQKNDVKDAELGVKRAKLDQQEAVLKNKRAKEDAARARKDGVEGSEQVIAARQRLADSSKAITDAERQVTLAARAQRDAIHAQIIATRELKDAELNEVDAKKKQTAAQTQLQAQLAQLSPTERRLFNVIRNLQKKFKEVFQPITDTILNAVIKVLNRLSTLLDNQKFIRAFQDLADAIAAAIVELGDFFTSDEFIDSFIKFIHEAAKNLPNVVHIIENLADAFVTLSNAGSGLFAKLLGGTAGLTGKVSTFLKAPVGGNIAAPGSPAQKGAFNPFNPLASVNTPAAGGAQQNNAEKFLSTADKHLDSWLKLASAIGRVFKLLIGDAAPAGQTLVGRLTHFFDRIADWLEKNPEKVRQFFDDMAASAENLAKHLGKVAAVLFKAFSSKEAEAFSEIILEVVIPGLVLLLQTLGLVSRFLLFIFNIPGLGPFIKFVLQFLIFEKALNRIFPITQKVTDAFKKLTVFLVKDMFKGFKYTRTYIQFFILRVKEMSVAAAKAVAGGLSTLAKFLTDKMVSAFKLAGDAALKFLDKLKLLAGSVITKLTNSWGKLIIFLRTRLIPTLALVGRAFLAAFPYIAIAAAIAAIAYVIYKYRKQILRFLGEAFDWIKKHWKLLALILLGPFAPGAAAIIAIIKWRKQVIGFFKSIIDWVRDHWKTIVKIILAIFLPGGLLLVGIWKFHKKIIEIFGKIKEAIIGAFKAAFDWVREEIPKLVHWIGNKLSGLPIVGRFFKDKKSNEEFQKDLFKQILPKLPDNAQGRAKELRKQGKNVADVLKALQKEGLISKDDILHLASQYGANVLFDKGGEVGGKQGKAVPIIAHAGEWVLNKVQQMKLARRLGAGTEQVSNWLFGTNMGTTAPGPHTTGTRPTGTVLPWFSSHLNLIPHTDKDGNVVWFVEFPDKTYGQVSARDARRIKESNGNWLPGYVKRSSHADKVRGKIYGNMRSLTMARGGVVPSFAMGGVISSGLGTSGTTMNIPTRRSKSVPGKFEQNFNVQTQGETDWNYVMRLAAIHAQGTY